VTATRTKTFLTRLYGLLTTPRVWLPAVVGLTLALSPGPQADIPLPADLLASVTVAYASFDAFDATGVVTDEEVADGGRVEPGLFGRRDFTVFYSSPQNLLFSMIHRGSAEWQPWSLVLAVDGDLATTASTPDRGPATTSVALSLSGAAGITSEATSLLVGLLLPNAGSGLKLSSLADAHVDGASDVRGIRCWQLSGMFPRHATRSTLSISQADSLVLKAVLPRTGDSREFRHTIELTSIHARHPGEAEMTPRAAPDPGR
jgi:hypothetical protein